MKACMVTLLTPDDKVGTMKFNPANVTVKAEDKMLKIFLEASRDEIWIPLERVRLVEWGEDPEEVVHTPTLVMPSNN